MERGAQKQGGFIGLLMLLISAFFIASYLYGGSLFSRKGVTDVRSGVGTIHSELQAIDAASHVKNLIEAEQRALPIQQP